MARACVNLDCLAEMPDQASFCPRCGMQQPVTVRSATAAAMRGRPGLMPPPLPLIQRGPFRPPRPRSGGGGCAAVIIVLILLALFVVFLLSLG